MRFNLENQIGEKGGFGIVYRCKDENEQVLHSVCNICFLYG